MLASYNESSFLLHITVQVGVGRGPWGSVPSTCSGTRAFSILWLCPRLASSGPCLLTCGWGKTEKQDRSQEISSWPGLVPTLLLTVLCSELCPWPAHGTQRCSPAVCPEGGGRGGSPPPIPINTYFPLISMNCGGQVRNVGLEHQIVKSHTF